MFDNNSRYSGLATYQTTTPDGRTVVATTIPLPGAEVSAGLHRRVTGDRLDLLAARYLNDPTTFWRICDLNAAPVAASIEARELIAIPSGKRP